MPLTTKGLAYLVVAYVFIGLAVVFRQPVLTAFVIPNAILLFFSSRKPLGSLPKISVARRMNPQRSFGGESIDVAVQILNKSDTNLDELQLEDRVPESLKLEAGSPATTVSIRPREQTQLWFRISAPKRGTYVFGPMSFRITDLFGLHEKTGQVPAFDDVTVLPKMENLGPIDLRARRVGPWPGMIPSRRIGLGTEFFELRDYMPGDDLRRINWKASAKSTHLMANEFEGEQVTDVLLLVDCSEGSLSKLFNFDVAELELSLAASLCSQLIQQGNRVGLSVYGAVRTWVDPGFGKRQLLRLLNSLAGVRAGKATLPLSYAVESVIVSVVPARSVIIVISPVMSNDIVNVVTDLAANGYGTLCFTPVVSLKTEGLTEAMILARRILAAERKIKLRNVGSIARIIEFSPETDVKFSLRRWKAWTKP